MKPLIALVVAVLATPAMAANSVQIDVNDSERCIRSNGTPTHMIGQFPNRSNPHRFKAQTVSVCVDAKPKDTGRITRKTNASGISLTGIIFRPGTADFYDARSPRGFSRNPNSGWRLEGMGAAESLGMDHAHAHVDHRGMYHYHAPSAALLKAMESSLIGYAADGFEIHYMGSGVTPSWRLKQGTRPTAPGGSYDGTYEQDWVYAPGSGNLDECNGAEVNGRYVYFATDSYPFFPRCFRGRVSQDFLGRP